MLPFLFGGMLVGSRVHSHDFVLMTAVVLLWEGCTRVWRDRLSQPIMLAKSDEGVCRKCVVVLLLFGPASEGTVGLRGLADLAATSHMMTHSCVVMRMYSVLLLLGVRRFDFVHRHLFIWNKKYYIYRRLYFQTSAAVISEEGHAVICWRLP